MLGLDVVRGSDGELPLILPRLVPLVFVFVTVVLVVSVVLVTLLVFLLHLLSPAAHLALLLLHRL